jgi:nitroreductase
VVRDPKLKRHLRDWYLQAYDEVTGGYREGDNPIHNCSAAMAQKHEVPALIIIGAVLDDLIRTDAELDRPGIVGGASVYPSVETLLLAARAEGLGATLTTMLVRWEPEVKQLLGIPDEIITAGTIALGHPARPLATKLTRRPAAESVFAERYGEPLWSAAADS